MLDRKQIAEKLGVKPETFRKCIESRPDFPRPSLRLSQKMVLWEDRDFERWYDRQKQLAKA